MAGIKHDDGGAGDVAAAAAAAAAVAAIATGEVENSAMVMFVCFGTSRSSAAATAAKSVKCKIFRLAYKALNSTLLIFK